MEPPASDRPRLRSVGLLSRRPRDGVAAGGWDDAIVRQACLAPTVIIAATLLLPTFTVAGNPLDVPVIAVTALLTGLAGHWSMKAFPAQRAMVLAFSLLAFSAFVGALGQTSAQYTAAVRMVSEAALLPLVLRALARGGERARDRLLDTFYVCASIGALSLLLQYLHVISISSTAYADELGAARDGGLLGYPNFAAYAMLAAIVVRFSEHRALRGRDSAMMLLLLTATFLTGARTALVGAGIAVVLAVVLRPGRIGWVAAVSWLVPLAGSTVLARFATVLSPGQSTNGSDTSWRLYQWKNALALTRFPYIKGIGYNRTEQRLADHLAVHSGYVQAFVELGLLGTFALALIIITALRGSFAKPLLWPTVIFMLFITSTDPGFLYPTLAYLFLLTYGLFTWSPATAGSPARPDLRDRFAGARGGLPARATSLGQDGWPLRRTPLGP